MRASADLNPLEAAIRAIPPAWFRPRPFVYWIDLLTSAAVGWGCFAVAVLTTGAARVTWLILGAVALYRAVLFIHEITHLARRDVPGFTAVWNATVGVPLLLPSFLYEGVHNDHHRQRCYGTPADPEYVPFGRRGPLLIAAYVAGSALLPVALAIRFAIIAPASWLIPPLRRFTVAHLSALVINTKYVRRAPLGRSARLEEAAACAFAWTVAGLWSTGIVPSAAVVCWTIVTAGASTVNALRTLAAHRYDRDDGELTMVEQLLDSCTIEGRPTAAARLASACRAIAAPVGLRYHALHHWIPSLPYHNLGRTHRLLVTTLGEDAPYRAATYRAFTPVVADLVQRSRTQRR